MRRTGARVRVAGKLTMVVGTIPKMDEDELPVLLQRHDGKSRRTVIDARRRCGGCNDGMHGRKFL